MSRPNGRNLATLLLLLGVTAGCTTNRIASELTTGLEWAGLRSHSDINSSNRWQLPPGTRIRLEEQAPAAETVWIEAARDGLYRVFPPPGASEAGPGRSSDLLLKVGWPETAVGEGGRPSRIGRLLPDARGRVHIRLFLCAGVDQRVVQSTSLVVDPHWFSFHGARPDQISNAFTAYARSLAGRS